MIGLSVMLLCGINMQDSHNTVWGGLMLICGITLILYREP